MHFYLFLLSFVPLLLAGQSIPHTVEVVDVHADGEDRAVLELYALAGKLYWATEGEASYLSNGTAASTVRFAGDETVGFRSGLTALGRLGEEYYFYYPHDGKGYYVKVDSRLPHPRELDFDLINKEDFVYSAPVMSGNHFYLLAERLDVNAHTHVRQLIELDPVGESARLVVADTLESIAEPYAGRIAQRDGLIYFSRFRSGASGPAVYDVNTGEVTDFGTVETTTRLDFDRVGQHLLLGYMGTDERAVTRFVGPAGGGAEHQEPLRNTTSLATTSGLIGLGQNGRLYAIDGASGATTELLSAPADPGAVTQLHALSDTEVLFVRSDDAGGWILGRTDGTTGNTIDIATLGGLPATGATQFADLGPFVALTAPGSPLYLFDPVSETVEQVTADRSSALADPGLAVLGDRLFFAATDPVAGHEIHALRIEGQEVLAGTVYRDDNGNGVRDSDEPGLPNIPVAIGGSVETTVYSDDGGTFSVPMAHGDSYTVTTDPLECYALTTAQASFSGTYSSTSPPDLNFGFYPDASAAKLHVLLSAGRVRCNTSAPYWLTVRNDGCLPLAGSATVTLPEAVGFVEADPAPSGQSGTELTFRFDTLRPGQTYYTLLELSLPDETRAGEDIIVSAAATATTAGGLNASASDTNTETLRCAVDPNDIRVTPSRREPSNSNYTQLDEVLTYTIRFQNTGNDTAFRVAVEDELPVQLDLNTFRPLAASHDYTWKMHEAGRVVFTFADIMLPDSTTDVVGSQGYVAFEIMARQDLEDFTVAYNNAAIYFDRNAPVITNTVHSTFVADLDKDDDKYNFYEDCNDYDAAIYPGAPDKADNDVDENCDGVQGTTSLQSAFSRRLEVYPVPATRRLTIATGGAVELLVELYDLAGRRINRSLTGSPTTELDVSGLPPGVYHLRLTDRANDGVAVRRVVVTR